MAEKRIVCFQSKKVNICRFIFNFNNYYIYLKRYFEKFRTNDFCTIFWRTAALRWVRAFGMWVENIKSAYTLTWQSALHWRQSIEPNELNALKHVVPDDLFLVTIMFIDILLRNVWHLEQLHKNAFQTIIVYITYIVFVDRWSSWPFSMSAISCVGV